MQFTKAIGIFYKQRRAILIWYNFRLFFSFYKKINKDIMIESLAYENKNTFLRYLSFRV